MPSSRTQQLYLHRSRTGMGVYQAQFAAVDGGWRITSAWVAGDHDSYRRRDDNFESAMLEALSWSQHMLAA
jgi:hypothetical protein